MNQILPLLEVRYVLLGEGTPHWFLPRLKEANLTGLKNP